jgi:hypothetical protein
MRVMRAARFGGVALIAATIASACGADEGVDIGGEGGGSAGTGGDAAEDPAAGVYPDVASLHALGVARTCALNEGVCHASRQWPELASVKDMIALVNAPCQIAAAEPSLVPDECERPGDELVVVGTNLEILHVVIDASAPFPPVSVVLRLAAAPPSLETSGARVRRLGAGGVEVLSLPLEGVTLAPGPSPETVVVGLSGSTPAVRDFLDVRVTSADRVRVGDANGNGIAHASPSPWSLVVPGDPGRSYLYKRLLSDKLGARMPLIERTWSALATRAMWCWIRGMGPDASAATLSIDVPIDYASCPIDPDAPDPSAGGTWASVRALMGSRCATAPCHSGTQKAGALDLSPDGATFLANVINVPSAQRPGVLRVAPGQPAASYLLCKMDPACEARAPMTELMPVTGEPLTKGEIDSVSKWISAGAKIE